MSYQETTTSSLLPRRLAKREIESQGADWSDFLAECGDRSKYSVSVVNGWLGN